MSVKNEVFWDLMHCRLSYRYQRCAETYCLHLQDFYAEITGVTSQKGIIFTFTEERLGTSRKQ